MDDAYFRDRISAYFDKDLPPEEYQAVDNWLKNSPEGRKALEELGRLDEFVTRQLEVRGGDEFFEQQARSIEQKLGFRTAEPAEEKIIDIGPRSRWRSYVPKIAAVAVSAAVLVFIGVNYDRIFTGENLLGHREAPSDISPRTEQGRRATIDTEADSMMAGEQENRISSKERDTSGLHLKQKTEIIPPERLREREPDVSLPEKVTEVPSNDRIDAPPEQPSPTIQHELAKPEAQPELAAPLEDKDLAAPAPELEKLEPQQELTQTARRAASPSAAAEGGTVDSTAAELAVWRKVRDEMMDVLKVQVDEYSPSEGYANQIRPKEKSVKTLGARQGGLASASHEKQEQARLIEACFNIVRLTPDADEREGALRIIRSFAADSTSASHDLARKYLDSLESD